MPTCRTASLARSARRIGAGRGVHPLALDRFDRTLPNVPGKSLRAVLVLDHKEYIVLPGVSIGCVPTERVTIVASTNIGR